MDDAPVVSVMNGLAGVDELPQQLSRAKIAADRPHSLLVKLGDSGAQVLPDDQSHRVERPTVWILAQAIHGNDARVFECASDFGFTHEPLAAGLVVGVRGKDLLQRDFAIDLAIARDLHPARGRLARGAAAR